MLVAHIIILCKHILAAILIMKFPPRGFPGTFSMEFYIICWTYLETNQLDTNLLNDGHNSPGHLNTVPVLNSRYV